MTGLNRDDALKRADAAQPGLLDCLQTLIRQPSVSATGEGIDECAALVGEVMEEAGIHTEVLRLDGAPPLVCGEVRSGINPDRTLLFYNHYDVQSPEPLDLWQDPPFSGRVIGDKIFGRGASDDKGELVTRIKAVESYLQACGDVPCNIKFVVEGGLVRNSPNRLDPSDTFNDPRSPARGNERTQQTGRILAVL